VLGEGTKGVRYRVLAGVAARSYSGRSLLGVDTYYIINGKKRKKS
jgi:hypothetical protein